MGQFIRVNVSYTDDGGTPETVTVVASGTEGPVTVENVNDNPTAIAIGNNTVKENEVSGTVVGSFSTTDADTTDNHTYTLVAGEGDSDNDLFEIVNGQLQTNAVFDFETKASYDIRVQTNDGNGGTFDQPFTITVENVNEAGEASITGEIKEDSPLTVIVTDPEGISTGSSYQWQSSPDGNTWTDIPNATNENFTPGDDQVGQFIRVNVSYTDDGGTPETVTVVASGTEGPVTVENVNEAGEATITGEVKEDSPLTVIVTDPDGISTGSSYQWQSSPDGNTWTDIPNATNENFTPGDDQVGQFIRVNVSYTDNGGTPETVTVVASGTEGPVTVENVNDNPTAIALNSNTVAENETVGTVVGSFSTTDADTTDTHTYTLVTGDGDTDNAQFQIVNGQLQTNAVFDFETKTS